MKKRNLFFSLIALGLLAAPVYAQNLESVRVIKFWDVSDDMVIERSNGERLLLQHHRLCSTMSTEFPIQILWSGNKITEAKVASNERCKVYNAGPYSSDITIKKRISSGNALETEHLAEVEWQGGLYQIDYDKGCKYLRDFVDDIAYVYAPDSNLKGGTLYLPKNRGQCAIKSATLLEKSETPPSDVQNEEFPLKNLDYKAENNQVLFSWDAFPADESWIVLVSYSKFQLNPDDLTLQQMPGLKRSRTNSIKMTQLVNGQDYYFYITAKKGDEPLAPWKEIMVTPQRTANVIINRPDPEKFDIVMSETDAAYHLEWPDKSEGTRKYMLTLYIDGKRTFFKYLNADQHAFDIEKKAEWSKAGFRATISSLPLKLTGPKYFDSIFWSKK